MINVFYAGNDKYFKQIFLSVLSMAKTTKETLNIYIMTLNCKTKKREYFAINQNQVDYLETVIKKYNSNNKITLLDMKELYNKYIKEGTNANTVYSPYSMLRLLAIHVDTLPSKIIYLDTDTMIYNDINELYSIDLKDAEYASVKDAMGHYWFGPNYSNSGVLLCNLDKIKETKLFEKCIHYVNTVKSFMPDQDALNKLKTKRIIIDSKFNNQRKMKSDTVVKHFCKVLKFFPYIHTINIKQTNFDKVHDILKIHEFDDVFNEYKELEKGHEDLLFD